MKLYDFTRAPNPRRVRIFLAEKGITVPMEQIDLFIGANRTPEALGRNPYGGLPTCQPLIWKRVTSGRPLSTCTRISTKATL